jgi:hypothetical protein
MEEKYNSVLQIIEDRLIPDQEAKKARGEVFTPLDVVRGMLYGFRKSAIDQGKTEIWGMDDKGELFDDDEHDRLGGVPLSAFRDADSTWLDPANGIGNFPVIAFYMLDYQLDKHGNMPSLKGNLKKRRDHIIKKMLFMIELNKGNVNTSKKIFKLISPQTTPNICCANALQQTDDRLQTQFGTNRFTVIMGNPPYNEGGTHQSGRTIWPIFITTYLKFLEEDGYLLFVNGQGWRGMINNRDILDEMKKLNLLHVSILGKAFPTVNYPVDSFVLQNNSRYRETSMYNKDLQQYDDVDISNMDVIPNFLWNVFIKWANHRLKRLVFQRTHSTSSSKKKILSIEKDAAHPYPIMMNIDKDGPTIKYSSVKHPLQDKIKVLVAFSSSLYPYVDHGEYGMSENVICVVCDSVRDATKIKDYLENRTIICLMDALKIGSYAIMYNFLSILPDPTEFHSKNISESLYINKKEQEIIDKKVQEMLEMLESQERKKQTKKKKQDAGSRFRKTRKN